MKGKLCGHRMNVNRGHLKSDVNLIEQLRHKVETRRLVRRHSNRRDQPLITDGIIRYAIAGTLTHNRSTWQTHWQCRPVIKHLWLSIHMSKITWQYHTSRPILKEHNKWNIPWQERFFQCLGIVGCVTWRISGPYKQPVHISQTFSSRTTGRRKLSQQLTQVYLEKGLTTEVDTWRMIGKA